MSPTSFPTISSGEAWDTGPGQASTLMNQITGAINALESASVPAIPTNYLAPSGALAETYPRQYIDNNNLVPTSGVLYLIPIALPTGLTVGHINFVNLNGMVGQTHWWFGLYNSSRVQLAVTADQTTAIWTTDSLASLAIATIASGASSTFTTTYTGLHYLGVMVVAATTRPSLLGRSVPSGTSVNIAPLPTGPSTTGQTTPPAFPFTAASQTATSSQFPYGYVSA